jgi:hypothetical protein
MIVRVKGKGVKLSGKWCYKNEEAEIDENEYEKNKEYLDIIKEDKNVPKVPQIPGPDDKDQEEIELQALKIKAKELGIRNYHLMGKEKLEEVIAEKEAPMFGQQSDTNEGEENKNNGEDNENPNVNDDNNHEGELTGEDNPQE